MFDAIDHQHMALALQLAEKGLYTARPNPRVGCVIAQGKRVVGTGWHKKAGELHAEPLALAMAQQAAKGATAYVTLEPCVHQGRTPPCVPALLQAGIRRVVVAMEDPDPRVKGQGMAQLRGNGVLVDCGLMQDQALALNLGFVSRLTKGRPWVRLKIAASLDGGTALANGHSQWITSPQSREDVHRWRARSCAILTGIGTVRQDDPLLTVRGINFSGQQPLRVVVDSHLAIDVDAKVLQGGALLAFSQASEEKIEQLRLKGIETKNFPLRDGKVDLLALMRELAQEGINEVLIEAGATLNRSFIDMQLVDEVVLYFSAKFLGPSTLPMLSGVPLTSINASYQLKIIDICQIECDIRIIARPI